MRRYLRDPTFSRFDTIPECDGHTHTHTHRQTHDDGISALSKASRGKNVGPIRDCEPPHAHSPGVTTGTVARRLCIDVHDANDDNDNA